jgi:hypothetical protein
MIDEEIIHAKIDIIETNLKLLKEIGSQEFSWKTLENFCPIF